MSSIKYTKERRLGGKGRYDIVVDLMVQLLHGNTPCSKCFLLRVASAIATVAVAQCPR